MYCTYLTTYTGNKMPPFYIGSTSLKNIKLGYKGSVSSKRYKSIWESEIINNPSKFKVRVISIHETRQEAYVKEDYLQRTLKIKNNDMYINKCYAINGRDGKGINNNMYGRKRPDIKKRMVSNNPMKNPIIALKMAATRKLLDIPSPTKGIPNTSAIERMVNNNPMKNIETSTKMLITRYKNNGGIDPTKNTIWVANMVLKIRKRVTSREFDLLDSSWIKLSNRKEIPDQEHAIHSDLAACTPANV